MNPNDYQTLSQRLSLFIVAFLLWVVAGIAVLVNGVTPFAYACVWGCLIFELFCDVLMILYQMRGKKR